MDDKPKLHDYDRIVPVKGVMYNRLRVDGGWIYSDALNAGGLCFVPDRIDYSVVSVDEIGSSLEVVCPSQ